MWDHEPSPSVRIIALRTPTLPPATTTNAVIIGEDERWVIDPAPHHEHERERLLAVLADEKNRRGLAGIALSHHHRDHIGAAAWLAERLSLPVAAHADTLRLAAAIAPRLVAGLEIARSLEDGASLMPGWLVLHTPGHASDHLVFIEERTGQAVVGDMVASVGTIVVDPPDGHMRTYLKQLERLRDLDLATATPAHGAPIARPSDLFSNYLAHRLAREELVAGALSETPRELPAITVLAYPELPRALLQLAERACLAHLEKLHEDGRATWSGARVETPRACLAPGNRWMLTS